jgi:O-antigen/teichoic acid export membrane protein
MAAATSIYYSLTTAMLGFLNTNEQVGFFDASARIKNILIFAVSALGNVLLPRLSFYYQQHENEKIQQLLKKAFDFVFSVSTVVAAFFIIYANDVLIILCGRGYVGATSALQVLMPTIIFVALSTTTGMQMLIPAGREKVVLASTVIGAGVTLLLSFVLLRPFGAVGASFVVSATELTVLLVQYLVLRDSLKKLLHQVHFLQILSSLVLPGVVSFIAHSYWDANPLISVFAGSVIMFGGFTLMLYLQHVPLAIEGVRILSNLLKKHTDNETKK